MPKLNESKDDKSPELLQQVAKELYGKNLDLSKERKRLQEILHQVAEVVFAVDPEYKITLFNSSAEEIFDISKENALDRNPDEFIILKSEGGNKTVSIKNYAFKHKREIPDLLKEPVMIEAKNGETIYFKINYNNIMVNGDLAECVVSLSDVTEEIEIDKEKDEFVSIASHELKTPVTIIKNNLWMFKHKQKGNFTKGQIKLLDEMSEGTRRLSKIVNNLLDISKIEQGRFVIEVSELDIDKIFLELVSEFDDLANSKGLKLIYNPVNIRNIKSDKERLIEVLNNLISNAIKYTKEGEVTIRAEENDYEVKFFVTDTGPGISEMDYGRIFKKFGRAHEGLKQETVGSSTGLGLYISKRIIEELGGKIGFKSKVGVGSTFWFSIPKSIS